MHVGYVCPKSDTVLSRLLEKVTGKKSWMTLWKLEQQLWKSQRVDLFRNKIWLQKSNTYLFLCVLHIPTCNWSYVNSLCVGFLLLPYQITTNSVAQSKISIYLSILQFLSQKPSKDLTRLTSVCQSGGIPFWALGRVCSPAFSSF